MENHKSERKERNMQGQRNNKIDQVQQYLLEHKQGINTWQAIELFGDTRLSGTIWYLKNKRGMKIGSRIEKSINRYGRPVTFNVYFVEDNG